jgi:hypothetical protein
VNVRKPAVEPDVDHASADGCDPPGRCSAYLRGRPIGHG